MKRSREEKIMLDALSAAGYEATSTIKDAVSSGLRAIRREKYEEHVASKQARKKQKASYRKMKMSRDTKTLKAIREILELPETAENSA